SQGLSGRPDDIANLKGDAARAGFVEHFKEVQKLKIQLDQYTDLTPEQAHQIEQVLPTDEHRALRGAYLETAQRLRAQQGKGKDRDGDESEADQLDFEFVLFASATIDYDYIMQLAADISMQPAGKASMSREELAGLIAGDAKFIDEREDITEYVRGLKAGAGLDEAAIRAGYERFKKEKAARELAAIAERHGLAVEALTAFVEAVLARRIFDGEALTDLLEPLELGWKARAQKEGELMADLAPLLRKRAVGREIAGLKAWEEAR